MASDKDDLTRIEDLAEFLHQEDIEEDIPDFTQAIESESSFQDAQTQDEIKEEIPSFELSDLEQEQPEENFSQTSNENVFEEDQELKIEDFPTINENEDEDADADESFTNLNFSDEFQAIEENSKFNEQKENIEEFELSTNEPEITKKEDFQELKTFSENISYGKVLAGGNPPFSIVVKNITYIEDGEDIFAILKEHGLINPSNEESTRRSIAMGSLLVSQISEYAAVYLAHKFRRFKVEILVGLSDELHPSSSYNEKSKGLVNKQILSQNHYENIVFDNENIDIKDIILATTPTLEGYSIVKYLGIATEHSIIDMDDVSDSNEPIQDTIDFNLEQNNIQENELPPATTLSEIYTNLAQKLKAQCLKQRGNAVIGINYQLTPYIDQLKDITKTKYKVTCTGNIVLASRT